jgi:hypothetical protein
MPRNAAFFVRCICGLFLSNDRLYGKVDRFSREVDRFKLKVDGFFQEVDR